MPADDRALIPNVKSLRPSAGRFVLGPDASISAEGPGSFDIAELLAEYVRPPSGFALPIGPGGSIVLCAEGEPVVDDAGFADETYALSVREGRIELRAPCAAGLARGIQTLRQLMPVEVFSSAVQGGIEWVVPCVEIEDAPRFRWRGMHLDVGRHTFSVEHVCRMIDLFALHKFNSFHLHLTEDQGWRIEIKKHPRLAAVGSLRPCTMKGHWNGRPLHFTEEPYGGFFTQDEIRWIVAFAARRHVVVVPEIDMPGHMQAAIAAYPELGNLKAELGPRVVWGISDHVLSPRPETIAFLRDVFNEAMAPGSHTYFDNYQAEPMKDEPLAIGGYLPTEKVYAYDPVPAGVAVDRRRHVLGAQAQLWTEYISTPEHLEYMAFPRACALAEVVWLDAEGKDYPGFLRRLARHRTRLAALGVKAHPRP
jgi:hexosaminidase